MPASIFGPIQGASPGLPGGIYAAYNVAAAAVVENTSAILNSISCIVSGTITVSDANNAVAAQTVTAITQAAQAVVTISTVSGSNPFTVGNSALFASVVGMTQINGLTGIVTAIGGASGAWTATVNINTTSFTAYASGGTMGGVSAQNEIGAFVMTAGQLLTPNWPCVYGLYVSAVSAGQFSVAFS